uniref:Uncharacterized protein n=1 Tax=Salix viminalis TaxID=40686 RepID=A0A6N2NBQ8_SALVM
MAKFVEDTKKKHFYDKVKQVLQDAMGCYDESIKEKFSDEEFNKMMFIDGCFILQFMHCLNGESEKLEMSDRQIFHNLKKVGILFRPRWSAGGITDVKFKSSFLSGKVEIPPISIDESTESLLLNLVAYESAAALDQQWVSSYILFMDSLIDDAEDVEEMRSNGIIINYLGADQKVANLFNSMGESLTDDTYDTYDTAAYNDVKMAINKQCESTVKRWAVSIRRQPFRSTCSSEENKNKHVQYSKIKRTIWHNSIPRKRNDAIDELSSTQNLHKLTVNASKTSKKTEFRVLKGYKDHT